LHPVKDKESISVKKERHMQNKPPYFSYTTTTTPWGVWSTFLENSAFRRFLLWRKFKWFNNITFCGTFFV